MVDLVRRSQNGDRQAFGALHDRFHRYVRNILRYSGVRTSDEDDMTQNVFLRVFEKIETVRIPEAFPGWLHTLTVRVAINNALRSYAKRTSSLNIDVANGTNPADQVVTYELRRGVRDQTGNLDQFSREVTELFYFRGMNIRQIADTLDVPIGTVKRRLYVARHRLRKLCEKAGIQD